MRTKRPNAHQAKRATKKARGKNQIVKLIKKELEVEAEHKYFQTNNPSFPGGSDNMTAATLYDLSGVPQQITQSNRVGDQILLSRITYDITVYSNSSFVGADEYFVRFIFFMWKADTALFVPVAGSILEAASLVGTSSHLARYRWDTRKQYKILYDTHAINPLSGPFGQLKVHVNKKLTSKITFTPTLTTGTNRIYMIAITDNPSNPPALQFVGRLFYTDS